jgi:uncharacterized protein (TIGR00251 family)
MMSVPSEMVQPTSDGGIAIDVRVIPRADRSGIAGTRGSALLVRLSAPPARGAANRELIDVIATVLDVPKSAVSIVRGELSRAKRIRVRGIDAGTARLRLAANIG